LLGEIFFLYKFKSDIPELRSDFIDFTHCESIYISTALSHYTIFFGDYFSNAKHKSFPSQLKHLGFNTRSFCNGAIIVTYPLKNIHEENIKNNRPFREEIISDLGIDASYKWNRKDFGDKFEDYYEAADDEKCETPEKWNVVFPSCISNHI